LKLSSKRIVREVNAIEQGLMRLEDERTGMQELLKKLKLGSRTLLRGGRMRSHKDRVELQLSLWSDGLHWSHENFFLNTRNGSLYQIVTEMMRDLGRDGGPSSATFEHANTITKFIQRFGMRVE
jgi:hypothetical protein